MTCIKRSARAGRTLRIEPLERRIVLDARLVITEFVASNDQGLQDEDGDRPDWLEVHNAGDTVANLSGWHLTDDAQQLNKWQFPGVNLEAQQYLVVFASGKDRGDPERPLHTNFQLRAAGEYLALVQRDGSVASAYATRFPAQSADVSFGTPQGSVPDTPQITSGRYFAVPTPGAANDQISYAGRVQDITVNIGRGFYEQPQSVAIKTDTVGATIAYTTDGSTPSLENGTLVMPVDAGVAPRAEMTIDATTTLRVAALKDDYLPSSVATHTYVFVQDVIVQSPDGEAPDGWPTRQINGQVFDYGMDPDIVNDPEFAPFMKDALLDIPSFSIVTDRQHLFDRETGLFVNGQEALSDGRAWERPTSVELIHPDGSPGFQVDAGLRMRGGFSRRDDNPKHAFRLLFRAEYGPAKLQFPLFGDAGVDQFDNIDLRTAQVPSWSLCWPGAGATGGGCRFNTMVRDVFTRDSQGDMGQPYTRSRYYHLYLNGQYWGLFQSQERPEASYAESYFGGAKQNYDVVKVEAFPHRIVATDGNLDAWRQLWDLAKAGFADNESYLRVQGLNADGTRNPDYPVLLDVDNLADYMVLIFYSGNLDSPISNFLDNRQTNNWFGMRDRTGNEGFRFFIHDAEWTLFDLDRNRLGPWPAGDSFSQSNPQWLHQQLMQNANYRLRFADRAHRHLFNEGALTPAASLERIQSRIDQIDLAIIAESARWGDTHRSRPYTKADWQREISRITEDHLPERTDVLIEQLMAAILRDNTQAPLYPSVAAPTFNQHGGAISDDFQLTMSGPGDVYFTFDGTDPRQRSPSVDFQSLVTTGADARILIPNDSALQTDWAEIVFDDQTWIEGKTGIGFQSGGTTFQDLIDTNIEPQMRGANASAYVRIGFQVDDPAIFDSLRLRVKYDDGFIAYLNGTEVARQNAPEVPQWNSTATDSRPNRSAVIFEEFNISQFSELLQSGRNLLAIHGLNRSQSGSDFLILPELDAGITTDRGVSTTAIEYIGPVALTDNTIVKARTLAGATWSALSEATFVAGRLPLRISEIMYHPANPTPEEQVAGFADDDDFEFIEVINTSDTESIDLQGVSFTEGIDFTFPQKVLEPGQRSVVARNEAALRQRYGMQIDVSGQYGPTAEDSRLSNQGETIRLVDALGLEIQTVQYDESWYPQTDGQGFSLDFVAGSFDDPALWSQPTSWSRSQFAGGTPGTSRLAPGDSNRDGVFDSKDFVQVFQAGEYEDATPNNSTWDEGDWNGDDDFNSRDLVTAFQAGGYVAAAFRLESNRVEILFDDPRLAAYQKESDVRRFDNDSSLGNIGPVAQPLLKSLNDHIVDRVFDSAYDSHFIPQFSLPTKMDHVVLNARHIGAILPPL